MPRSRDLVACLTLLLTSVLPLFVSPADSSSCSYSNARESVIDVEGILSSAVVRRSVDLEHGENSSACLNGSVPCRTLHYALHGVDDAELRSNVKDLVVSLLPGTYVLTGSQQIIDSVNVSILGAGAEQTVLNCGEFGDTDRVCDYMNFQIRNSTNVYISGITFTRCGPITSAVYVAFSDNIYFEGCVFRDTRSPSLLVHNTATVVLDSCSFANNLPEFLDPVITHDICYFSSGQDIFFVDNRTTSGGVSFYIKDMPATFLLVNSTFRNNRARPDNDVSLVRRSESYGHGGAVNLRLLHSSDSELCVINSTFVDNYAEAHGGGVVLSLAGNASNNTFVVSNCVFENNSCTVSKCTGGGLGLDLLAGSQFNTLKVINTNFTGNKANASGAISLSTSVSAKVNDGGITDKLVIKRCRFTRNEAFFEGTALGAYSLTHSDQIGIPLEIHDRLKQVPYPSLAWPSPLLSI